MYYLRIGLWNINGLSPHIHEAEVFLRMNKLDVLLIAESHAKPNSAYKISGYNIYITPHPDGTAHAGTALIIKSNIKHSVMTKHCTDFLQATTVILEDRSEPVVLSAVYCPPRHSISDEMFSQFFNSLGNRFIAGGDWNAKHTFWGSRISVTRGRELKKCVERNKLLAWSTGTPTYWPTELRKVPDLLDFFIGRGISYSNTSVESSLDGSSDHTPVILNLSSDVVTREQPETLHNFKTDWESYRQYIEENLDLNISLKSSEDVEDACIHLTNLIQVAAWKNTPEINIPKEPVPPLEIKLKIAEKRRLRRVWHTSRLHSDKTQFNKAAKDLKAMLHKLDNTKIENSLTAMSPTGKGEQCLWKSIKRNDCQAHNPSLRSGSSWARTDSEKAELFAKYLVSVFKPNETSEDDSEVDKILNQDLQMCLPIKPASPREIARHIKHLDLKKSPGYDLITPRVLKELPRKALTFLACMFNAIFRTTHFPRLWKISQIIMIPKPGKPTDVVSSYRPISLTPILSKLWEKVFLVRLRFHTAANNVIPSHQFGFRQLHSTIEQVHRVYNRIRECLEQKQYCSAVFLDVLQAFDRVWHKGLLVKIKTLLPHSMFHILESYLSDRTFLIKQGNARSKLHVIKAGVPQGSVLGPVLYNIYTSDLPTTDNVTVATYADDVAYLASDKDPRVASVTLQNALDKTNCWLKKWRVRASASKSNHITFTLRRESCPPVKLGDAILPHTECVKYLGFHLDRRLTWKTHIKMKRDQLNIKHKTLLWLMGRNSKLSVDNKLLLYKSILKPIWTYGIQLWGVASKSNVMCLQRAQNNILREIVNGPWFTRISEIHEYLNILTVSEEVEKYKGGYTKRLATHPNSLASELLDTTRSTKRLKRRHIF
jgi:hypothetical protein